MVRYTGRAVAAVAEIEAIVEPDGVADDIWWESMAFVSIHSPILSISAS